MEGSQAAPSAMTRAIDVPKRTLIGFWRGITYPFKGARFVYFQHPELAKWWIPPILMTVAAAIAVIWMAIGWHDDVVSWIWTEPTGDGFWAGVGRFFHGVIEILVAGILILLGLILVYLITAPIAAPFKAKLSDRIDEIVTGKPAPPATFKDFAIDAFRTVSYEVGYFIITLILWLLSLLLPVVGQIIVSVVTFIITGLYMAVDYIDWPASRRGHGLFHRFGLAWRHFWPMLGFGTGVWIFLFVPFVNLFFMPAAVAGGTLLYIDLEKEQEAKVNASPSVASKAA